MRSYPAQIGLGSGTAVRPQTPTLSIITSDGSVTATLAGDAGTTHYLKYKTSAHTTWQNGGSRSGNGNIIVTGLDNETPYIFIAYSQTGSGPVSLPAVAVSATLTEDTDNEFDELLESTAADFVNTFGEDVKYLPRGGGSRNIKMVINREPIEKLAGSPQGSSPTIEGSVVNNSIGGISVSEIDTGGDKIELQVRIGQAVQQRRITKIIDQDAGMMTVEIR